MKITRRIEVLFADTIVSHGAGIYMQVNWKNMGCNMHIVVELKYVSQV